MSAYTTTIIWKRGDQPFVDNKYKRAHSWRFDSGITIKASSSPSIVPAPFSDPSAVDPEEAFVASISSCHMLWFLFIAAERGIVVDYYTDNAEGILAKDESGKLSITKVTLRPHIVYDKSSLPGKEINAKIHKQAHEKCFIANSVKTVIEVESTIE